MTDSAAPAAEPTAEPIATAEPATGSPAAITIFDTTLRDGEQSPGCSMTRDEKRQIAGSLCDLGVDVIEAGFPIASPDDYEAVREIAAEYGSRATICGLARCREGDITRAWDAVREAERPRVHVFLATSAIHREKKLRMTPEQIIERAVDSVRATVDLFDSHAAAPDVEFSPEDAARTEPDFLCEVVERVIEAGATTVNIPDTVGYAVPEHFERVIRTLKTRVSNIDDAVISVHCHNDLGLAVANSLAAVAAGARQIECTINGLGERAGNAALEEVVMAMRTRNDFFNATTGIVTERLFPISQQVSRITGMRVQRNKAIVGQNAFAHESGIHQDGILKEPTTYEIMRPQDVGYVGEQLVLGKHSGRHAVRDRVKTLGYELTDKQSQAAYDAFIALADKKKHVYDADLVAILADLHGDDSASWSLDAFHAFGGSGTMPTATVKLVDADGQVHQDAATGDGPVDAVFHALERIIGIDAQLQSYDVRSVTEGTDAQGEVSVEIEHDGARFHGKGISTDTIEASARAYLQALNRAATGQGGHRPRGGV